MRFSPARPPACSGGSTLMAVAAVSAVALLGLTGTAAASSSGTALVQPGHQRVGAARVEALFPSNELTVRDRLQATGRRVSLPFPNCRAQVTDCHDVALLNRLDGFDVDPRLALTFDRAVDPAAVSAATTVTAVSGRGRSVGVDRVVYDAVSHTVYAHPARQLAPGATYRLAVGGGPAQLRHASSIFTTESATSGLLAMRRQLDDGSAYHVAGIAVAARGLRVDRVVLAAGAVLSYTADMGPKGGLVTSPVNNTSFGAAGSYVFGSYLAPSWLDADSVIAQRPTAGRGPRVTGQAQLPFVLIVPSGAVPAGGWPVAVFGHGFTRSDADLFLAADFNASRGLATIATDVVGHGYGPRSSWTAVSSAGTVHIPAYARGVDQNHDGTITSTEGSSAPVQPAPDASVGSRDGLRQTVADIMTLVRAVGRGLALPGHAGTVLRRTAVSYYGQSFGGIYGVMLGGTDPLVPVLAPNVSGGPISEIARLSPSFRLLVTQDLAQRKPPLLNGGYDGFNESMPLRGDAPVTSPAPGALAIQQAIANETWIDRSGSPETFAPLLRANPPAGSPVKRVLLSNAFGDQTVPNPTTYTELLAGGLFDRETLYRNDKTPNATSNPHGFLLNPAFVRGNTQEQNQIATFLASAGTRTINPDPTGPISVFEVPINNPDELRTLNFANPVP